MARRVSTKLKVLPAQTGPKTVPTPKVKPSIGAPFSPRQVKGQLGISVPGVKTV